MNDIRAALFDLRILRNLVERRMDALPNWFNSTIKHGQLRLRAWRRAKDGPPYAVYWILLSRQIVDRFSWRRRAPRFPFRRLKIRTRQDLDDAIYHGLLSSHRHVVYRYHARATALNAVHSSISLAIDGIRKLLQAFRPGARFTDGIQRAEAHLAAFECAVDNVRTELQAIDVEMRIYASYLPLRLVFERDAHHAQGRLRWRWVRDGRPESPLTDRRKRELQLPAELQPMFTPYELRRRQTMARLNRLSRIARRLRSRVLPVPNQVRTMLEAEGVPIPQRESA